MFETIPGFVIEYLPVVVFFMVAALVSFIMIGLPFLLADKKPSKAKLAPYECGFDVFEEPRSKFDVRFYLVALLFVIFDLEVIFLFPWAVSLGKIGVLGFWSMMVFLAILTIGFIYEWKKGALEWN